ncbi:MAG: class I SAM-dependent methyltransferase [Acidimicrobiales bacterium]
MGAFDARVVAGAYHVAAEDYAVAFGDDLDRLPVDRAVLDDGARRLTAKGPVLDVGCGPAQIGQYLTGRGLGVVGVDLAHGMLVVARRRAEGVALTCGDMRALPVRSAGCAGVVAFYSIQHVPRESFGGVLGEFRRVLVSGGILILATHLGAGEVYVEEFLGHPIQPVAGTLYGPGELEDALARESFVVEDVRQRDPLSHEHQSKRIYLIARRP